MFQEMINGSVAVLTKPSVATFEEHERNNLQWALIYSVLAGVINAIFVGLGALLFPQANVTGLEEFGGTAAAGPPNIIALVFFTIIFSIIGLLFYWGVTFALGRAFGGTGEFGELAYDMALFSAPLTVVSSFFSLIPFVGGIASLVLSIYSLYLTYLAIQAGMNLPSNKALYVILILFAIIFAIGLCIALFFVAIFAAIMGGTGGFAP